MCIYSAKCCFAGNFHKLYYMELYYTIICLYFVFVNVTEPLIIKGGVIGFYCLDHMLLTEEPT